MTRLIDLKPRWIGANGSGWIWERHDQTVRFGVSFDCPHCGQRIAVLFKPFIDLDQLAPLISWVLPDAPNPNTGVVPDIKWWDRQGETFDDLTLMPSINIEGHWHGFITEGNVT